MYIHWCPECEHGPTLPGPSFTSLLMKSEQSEVIQSKQQNVSENACGLPGEISYQRQPPPHSYTVYSRPTLSLHCKFTNSMPLKRRLDRVSSSTIQNQYRSISSEITSSRCQGFIGIHPQVSPENRITQILDSLSRLLFEINYGLWSSQDRNISNLYLLFDLPSCSSEGIEREAGPCPTIKAGHRERGFVRDP